MLMLLHTVDCGDVGRAYLSETQIPLSTFYSVWSISAIQRRTSFVHSFISRFHRSIKFEFPTTVRPIAFGCPTVFRLAAPALHLFRCLFRARKMNCGSWFCVHIIIVLFIDVVNLESFSLSPSSARVHKAIVQQTAVQLLCDLLEAHELTNRSLCVFTAWERYFEFVCRSLRRGNRFWIRLTQFCLIGVRRPYECNHSISLRLAIVSIQRFREKSNCRPIER